MDIELKLMADIEAALSGVKAIKNDFSNLGDVTTKVISDIDKAFKSAAASVGKIPPAVKIASGSILELQNRLDQLKEKAVNVDITTQEFKDLQKEIIKTRDEIGIATGKFDEFGQRIKKGAGESIANVFEVGQAVVGIFNLGALAGFGEKVGKESELAARAIKGLVVLESLRAAGQGVLKAQELALDVVERGRAATLAITTTFQKAYNLAVAVYTGEVTLAAAATRLWGAAIAFATGPIGIAIAALGLIVGAVLAFTDSTEDNTEALLENAKAAAEAAKQRNELLNKIDELRTQIELEKGLLTQGEAERSNLTKQFFRERENLEAEHQNRLLEIRKDADLESEDGREAYNAKVAQENANFQDADEKRYLAYKTNLVLIDVQQNKRSQEEAEQDKKKREQIEKTRNDKIKQLRKELNDALLDLEIRASKAVASVSSQAEALFIEARLADQEIDRLSTKIQELNKANGEGDKLTDQQQTFIAQLRFANQVAYQQKLTQLTLDNERLRNSLILDAQEKEIAEFEQGFKEKEKALIAAGNSEEQITAAKNKGLLEINQKYIQDDLKIVEQIETNRINALERGFESETEFERRKAAMRLQLQIQIKQAQISNLKLDPEANRLDISNLEAEIRTARTELDKIGKEQDPISLASLLGLDTTLSTEEVNQVNEAFGQIISSLESIGNTALEFRKKQLDADKALNDEIVNNLNRRIDEEERALDREIQLRELGFASNIEGTRKTLADLKRQRDKELDDKKKLVEEEQKLARQQALIQALIQAANLATAGAQLFQKSVQQSGPAGVIVAIGAIAAMLASFIALVAQARQATRFKEGGWVKGPDHDRGGVDINAEGGEFVSRKKAASKYPSLLEGMNKDDLSGVKQIEIMRLLEGTGVSMSNEDIRPTIERGQEVATREGALPRARASELEHRIVSLDQNVKSILDRMDKEDHRTTPEGHQVIRKGNNTVIIRNNG